MIMVSFHLVNTRSCTGARRTAVLSKVKGGIPGLVGAFIPSCSREGLWSEIQCSGESGFCWCVRKTNGESLLGSSLRFERPLNCSSPCVKKRHSAIFLNARFNMVPFVPQCEKDGSYSSKQCDLNKRKCFCVKNKDSGEADQSTFTDFSTEGVFSSLQC